MRRLLILLMVSLCLSACQALALTATPVPLALSDPATRAPRPTWPPTWTPTASWTPTPTATATPQATATRVRPTLTPPPIETDHLKWTVTIKHTPTQRPATKAPRTATPAALPPRSVTPTVTALPVTKTVELRVFAVGDSVMLGAARELIKTIPGLEVDAKVSRHVGATLTILQQRRTAGRLGRAVIIHIGNNGPITAKQFDDLMQPLIDLPRVLVFNLKEPRKWETPNNQVISEGVTRYPNAVLIDWHTYGVEHPELFGPDGIHIGAAGAKAYTALVIAQLSGFIGGPADRPADNP
ncbi:MAG: hypothetical protein KA765_11510 [Thermoflexales bacterium]|nr:hypothetical protein [Thermoflexales bacterium]